MAIFQVDKGGLISAAPDRPIAHQIQGRFRFAGCLLARVALQSRAADELHRYTPEMATNMDLKEIFDEVSNQMKSDFVKAQKSLTRARLKGEANEETVRIFLRQYSPKTLDVTTGTLVDSDGSPDNLISLFAIQSKHLFSTNQEIRE